MNSPRSNQPFLILGKFPINSTAAPIFIPLHSPLQPRFSAPTVGLGTVRKRLVDLTHHPLAFSAALLGGSVAGSEFLSCFVSYATTGLLATTLGAIPRLAIPSTTVAFVPFAVL